MLISLNTIHIIFCAIFAAVSAQLLKPICAFVVEPEHDWEWSLTVASGGFPSSHSAMVSALALAVGFRERFSSTLFAITVVLAIIVIYDAANVRYYSGQNIKVTQQLVKDLQERYPHVFESSIYKTKLKPVLGHRWVEVVGGIIWGLIVAYIFYLVK